MGLSHERVLFCFFFSAKLNQNDRRSIQRALSILNIRQERESVLKPEQETAVRSLLHGKDVMAILPTGFGKIMILTVFALAKEELSASRTCVMVISPLKSIINDQISEVLSLNCTAMELTTAISLLLCKDTGVGKAISKKLSTGCQNAVKGVAVGKAANSGRQFLLWLC